MQAMERAKKFFLSNIVDSAETEIDSGEKKAAASIYKKSVHVYSHLDTDGLTSATILAQLLQRASIGFQITILRQLEASYIAEIAQEIKQFNRFIIFSDFGTGQLDLLTQQLPSDCFLILDHHKPEFPDIPHAVNHINPYYYDIRGEDEISAAGVVYLFAKTFSPKNIDLSHLAIIGAMGDMQNNGNQRTFHSINKIILQEAIDSGKISTELNVAISRSSPIDRSLCNTLSEKIPGISGELNHVQEFLRRQHIPFMDDLGGARTLQDLSEMEIRKLNSGLIQYAIMECGWSSEKAKKNYTTFYLLKDYNQNHNSVSNGREMSRLLNSCGRSGHPSLGIALLLGDREALTEALKILRDFKLKIRNAVQNAKVNIRELEHIYTVYESSVDERIIGTICSILIHSELEPSKPLFAFSDSDNHQLKISARADSSLVKKGLDLGLILREICKNMEISEPGGGHPPAAGAKIPANRLKTFIDHANEMVKEQLTGKKA